MNEIKIIDNIVTILKIDIPEIKIFDDFLEIDNGYYFKDGLIIGLCISHIQNQEKLLAILPYLKQLSNLEDLNCNDSFIGDIDFLQNLKKLKRISFNRCNLNNGNCFAEIFGLKELYLNGNEIKNLNFLKKLSNLEVLDLSLNPLKKISQITNLIGLKYIDLSDTELLKLPDFSKLINLEHLNISRIKNLIDIMPIKSLINLKKLYIHEFAGNTITGIKNLTNLSGFYSCQGKINDITPLQNLINLEDLYLNNNFITEIDSLEKLSGLIRLSIVGNKINNIDALKKFTHLDYLDISNNPIEELPFWITSFNLKIIWVKNTHSTFHEKSIIVYDNPLKSPPVEIIMQGNESIVRYFNKIDREGKDYIYEAKLTLVGEGSAGKTSLQKRLMNSRSILPSEDTRTRGIKIYDWQFKKSKGQIHIAHIWDFGGQDVYYPVHRFFLTENSVFILLSSSRQNHHNFDYWIPTIHQFGGASPILIAQTCHDGNKVSWNDLGYYVSNNNFNIIKTGERIYDELNLPNKNEGLLDFKKKIHEQIIKLPHYGKGVPSSWVTARKLIAKESMKTHCLTFETFSKLCRDSNPSAFTKMIEIEDFAKFLHSLGVLLWYYDNQEIKEWVVLRPEWTMNAVYKIIDDDKILKQRGNIFEDDFERVWADNSYQGRFNILKKLLQVFKIAFPKKHRKEDYIIPARLPSMPSQSKWADDEPFLRLEYHYEFMPKGLVNQVSAELSRYIVSEDTIWNNAVNFINKENSATCQVEEDFYNRKIFIKAKGRGARDLIILVMNALEDITDGYKGVKPEIHVPCTCYECINLPKPTTFLYSNLLRWGEKKKNAAVTCNESGNSLLIKELLYEIGLSKLENMEKKIFISYSKYDEDYLQDLQDHLVTLKSEGLATWDCREIEFGAHWDEEIKKNLSDSDVIICLISVKFLNTDYIKYVEIEDAIRLNKTIIPIIIKPCDWESSKLGKYQAAQRGKVVSLDNDLKLLGKIRENTHIERDAFWTSIIKEFRKKIFS